MIAGKIICAKTFSIHTPVFRFFANRLILGIPTGYTSRAGKFHFSAPVAFYNRARMRFFLKPETVSNSGWKKTIGAKDLSSIGCS